MWIVAIGNAFDGMRLVGPWDSPDEALAMLDNMGYSNEEFAIVEVDSEL